MTATVRNPDARDAVAELGAEVIEPEGFGEHGPFDVILELVGAPNLPDEPRGAEHRRPDRRDRDRRRRQGASSNLGVLMGKRARIHGSTLRARPLEEKALTARAMERSVLPLLALGDDHGAGRRDVPAGARPPAAYERFAAGGKLGKIVLEMAG